MNCTPFLPPLCPTRLAPVGPVSPSRGETIQAASSKQERLSKKSRTSRLFTNLRDHLFNHDGSISRCLHGFLN